MRAHTDAVGLARMNAAQAWRGHWTACWYGIKHGYYDTTQRFPLSRIPVRARVHMQSGDWGLRGMVSASHRVNLPLCSVSCGRHIITNVPYSQSVVVEEDL
jgi:hypothetical protein